MHPCSVFVCALIVITAATDVQQCPGMSLRDLKDNVQLIPCKKTPCRLKKGTSTNITISFVTDKDMTDIKNHVNAEVFGVPLPFVGVDGNSVCGKLYTESGTRAECPVRAGTKYIYKDSFPILSFYPTIQVKVHWALQDGKKNIVCFEVPARIS